ncbi:hypothetical protein CA267_001665 [Alteromonas pelagimontana]|uniref:Uncharacterized protein n=1 Tax=Alteromonas pelagimontana TaxID=1858656 RepID=A0A6M4M8T5_9ALTE|nr:hypothetical protein [Alteromonas pelagimontana]QJR79592.1 hypothetical protein CA267_001665 [Alteromonas pelagimontana]
MNEEKARAILGERIQPDNSLHDSTDWVDWTGDDSIQLDADFSVDELEAIAWWMRNKTHAPTSLD